jgi:hypothetical protein
VTSDSKKSTPSVGKDAYPVLDDELAGRLKALRGKEADKKRYTAILYGFARATPGVREDSIFDTGREDAEQICARSTWYGKWKNNEKIRAVWEYVEDLARTWRDAETLRIERDAQQLLKRSIAEGQVDAITGLRKTALSLLDRADFRTDASKTLLALGSAELAERLAHIERGALPVEITEQPEQVVKLDVSELPVEVLRAIANEGAESAAPQGRAEGAGEAESD